MRLPLALAFGLGLAAPAAADVAQVVNGVILPGYQAFADRTADLAKAAAQDCRAEALQAPWQAAFDAWAGVSFLHLGPAEEDGRALAIAFWPDPKALGAKAQRGLLTGDPAKLAPEAFAEQSVAARGLMGLERLLYPAEPLPADPCALIRATADDLARMADEVRAGWQGGFAAMVLGAGQPGNTTFLTEDEAKQALFTQLATGVEVLADQRLGRPMGTFHKPRPELAEARASGRSLRNVTLSLVALRGFAVALTPDIPRTLAGFDKAIALAEGLEDPVFAGVATPQGRLKVEIMQQSLRALRETMLAEMAPALGVGIGFNSQDGD